MYVTEIFYSIQGEGFLAGIPSLFIRMAGCPLRCRWCDTPYAFETTNAKDYSIEQIIAAIQPYPTAYVVITGGEPLVEMDMTERRGLRQLLQQLKACNKHITIETAGVIFVPGLMCDLMSISPKLSNAVFAHRPNIEAINRLIHTYNYQLKFVVERQTDIPEIESFLNQLTDLDHTRVMLMPQAATRQRYLEVAPRVAEWCKQTGFAFSPRLQVVLWDNAKGR